MMIVNYCVLLSILLLPEKILGASKEPLKCFSCDSAQSADCAQNDKSKLKQFETVCDAEAFFSLHNSLNRTKTEPFQLPFGFMSLDKACMKIDYTGVDGKKKEVMRHCSLKFDKCQEAIKNDMKNVSKYSCKQCTGSLCNSSPSHFINSSSFLMIVISTITLSRIL
ncbi:uncharacterized protein LOC111052497 [Nilaparvata lugens]|uniref:uncharacterized protein LOC111052497 n=1 Tax=Nilaparvata lugens TaxID=108931 RepID=UPI00193E43B5|nr:uncharacterized protein LOC111052497 [Nilaparvata lugens]